MIRAVDPVKDVDGFHRSTPASCSRDARPLPGTPLGVLALLDEYGVELQGANVTVLGRSDIVGKPAALLLPARHRHDLPLANADLAAETTRADVIVAAVGVPGIVTREMVKEGAAVVDVGINRTEAGLVGDVDPAVAERGAADAGPRRGRPDDDRDAARSTVRAARYRLKELAHPAA